MEIPIPKPEQYLYQYTQKRIFFPALWLAEHNSTIYYHVIIQIQDHHS